MGRAEPGAKSVCIFGVPKPLPILDPSIFVPRNGFPVVKGLTLSEPPNPSL